MFSLTTLPVHCCSTRRDVTDLISYPRNIACKASIYLGILRKLSMLRDRNTEALWSPVCTAVLQQNVLAKSLDRQTIWNHLEYYCLLNLTLQWRWQFWRNNMILSVQVLVKAVGVKLLKVFGTEITVLVWRRVVRQTQHKIVTGRGQGRGLGLEV